tara:strand:- start:398 stop:1804 length:1407 start_codon:yes stop_codon:yes gene_type:complete
MFISTRDYNHIPYRHIVLASVSKTKKLLNLSKINFVYFKPTKTPSVKYLFFLIKLILNGSLFSNNRANIKYENVKIGRFVLAETYKNYDSYLSRIKFYFYFIKNLYRAGKLIYSAKNYEKLFKIKGVYIDHCGYLNGVLYSFFSLKKRIIYTNNYPSNLYCVNFNNKKNKIYKKYEESLKLKKNKTLTKKDLKITNNFSKKMFTKKNFIPWMNSTKYQQVKNINFKSFDYIVYAHSFTDGQLWYGYDGFENTFDWLNFTLRELEKKGKRILVKAHPNFYRTAYGIQDIWDNKIFSVLEKKYKNNSNIYILNKPIFNNDILKKISKETILISHHGTVLLEASYYGYKSICSYCTFFNKQFKVSNIWKNKNEYKSLLNMDFKKLNYTNKNDILYLIYMIFIDEGSYSGKKFWSNIIRNTIGFKSTHKWHKKIEVFSNTKNPEKRISLLKKLLKNKEDTIIRKISNSIKVI